LRTRFALKRPHFFQAVNFGFLLAFGCALTDWFAVARANKTLEYVFKPATMLAVMLAALLVLPGARDPWLARFFLFGFAFSLAGDVFLMLPGARYFIFGLGAFLLAHLAYIVGLNPTLPPFSSAILLLPIGAIGVLLITRVVRGLRVSKRDSLVIPIMIYGVAISLMLFSAWATFFRPEWTSIERAWVVVGATLFFISDAMLAWNRFVTPFHAAALGVIVTYHLGQLALAATIAT
jgi:uncharacterized membrane protein YhhN